MKKAVRFLFLMATTALISCASTDSKHNGLGGTITCSYMHAPYQVELADDHIFLRDFIELFSEKYLTSNDVFDPSYVTITRKIEVSGASRKFELYLKGRRKAADEVISEFQLLVGDFVYFGRTID